MSLPIFAMVKIGIAVTLLVAFAWLCSERANSQAENSDPATYSETLQALSRWDGMGDDDNRDLAAFFANGDRLVPNFVLTCRTAGEDTQAKAYIMLLLIGSDKAAECAGRLRQEDPPSLLRTSDELSETEFLKLERLFRPRPCEKSGNCKPDDLPLVDESIIYGLVLDGSPRAQTLLSRMSKLAKASNSSDMLGFDAASHSNVLVEEARLVAHDMIFEASTFEKVFRSSLFFLPKERRAGADVKLLARNANDNRMLVTVSYTCGMLCGSGYYIVLKRNKEGSWDYALIMRAWIA